MSISLLASMACFRETYQARGLAWIFENTASLGLDGLEFYNLRKEDLTNIRKLMDNSQVISPSYCCIGTNFASSDDKERRKARDVIRADLEICKGIGAHIMRIDLGDSEISSYAEAKSQILDSISPCIEDAYAADVILAIHNHGLGWTGESFVIKDLLETVASKYLQARVCPGNFFLVEKESNPVVSATTLLSLAKGILLKDWRRVTDGEVLNENPTNINKKYGCYFSERAKAPVFQVRGKRYIGASIGKGVIDYARLFKSLNAAKYDGPLILKTEIGSEDDLTAIKESVAFIRNILGDRDAR